jgi:hypothetical protein
MKRIGIIGEHFHNDACAFAALLTPQYKSEVQFVPVLKSLKGGYGSARKITAMLPTEMLKNKLDAVICTHDLDEDKNWIVLEKWFKEINASIKQKGILYVAVIELEALILADIEKFNEIYKVDIKYPKNPKFESDPKKYLMDKTYKTKRKYDENHAEEIFKQLRFDIVYKKHNGEHSFKEFIDVFNARFGLSTPSV